jgi:hypothetical protein
MKELNIKSIKALADISKTRELFRASVQQEVAHILRIEGSALIDCLTGDFVTQSKVCLLSLQTENETPRHVSLVVMMSSPRCVMYRHSTRTFARAHLVFSHLPWKHIFSSSGRAVGPAFRGFLPALAASAAVESLAGGVSTSARGLLARCRFLGGGGRPVASCWVLLRERYKPVAKI